MAGSSCCLGVNVGRSTGKIGVAGGQGGSLERFFFRGIWLVISRTGVEVALNSWPSGEYPPQLWNSLSLAMLGTYGRIFVSIGVNGIWTAIWRNISAVSDVGARILRIRSSLKGAYLG